MKKIILIFIGLSCGILMNSCKKDLLDIQQHGALSPDTYYKNATDDQANQLIAAVYRQVLSMTPIAGTFFSYSDDAVAGDASINVNSQNNPQNGFFTSLYRVNYLCNQIIDNMPSDTDPKKQVTGEAYFWRAWAYIYLIRMWGTPPLVDHVLAPDELKPSNGDPTALWDYVDNSLNQAITLLPEKPGLGQQSVIGGRVTKGSARALLGKAQLVRGDYSDAITTLGNVISSGKYALEPDFRDLWHVAADFSDEYMWEFNMDDGDQANFENEGDNRAVTLTWRTENVTVPGGVTVQGFGAADFNKDFYDFMINHGEQGKPRMLGTIWSYEDILNRFVDLGLAADTAEAKGEFWNSVPNMDNCQGYFRIKMVPWGPHPEIPGWTSDVYDWITVQNIHSKANWPGMRYSEVLLRYAEACIQAGSNVSQGLAAINKVRERAGLADLGSYTLKDVKDEDRAELAYEGDRYLDLIRWGDAASLLQNRGSDVYAFYGYKGATTDYNVTVTPVQDAVGFTTNRDELWPFPYNERLLNPNLVQNTGWGN